MVWRGPDFGRGAVHRHRRPRYFELRSARCVVGLEPLGWPPDGGSFLAGELYNQLRRAACRQERAILSGRPFMRWIPVAIGFLLLAFGLACLNYTKPGTLPHLQEWAHEHAKPAPSNTVL